MALLRAAQAASGMISERNFLLLQQDFYSQKMRASGIGS
ncbi:hypothetical protein PORCAN_1526 [Porphyromonas crevioricanis JCM 13913]|nr:hypothetical protein PORCAN_1526 [Porphyromonas crevioricanis JCM 13913]